MNRKSAVVVGVMLAFCAGGCKSLPFGSASKQHCLVLVQVDPQLGQIQELDVFQNSPLCYDTTDIGDVDAYLDKANIVSGDVRLSTTLVDYINKGQKTWSNGQPMRQAAATIKNLLVQAISNGKDLIAENSQIVAEVKSNMTGTKSYKMPGVIKAVTQTGSNMTSAVAEAKKDLPVIQQYLDNN